MSMLAMTIGLLGLPFFSGFAAAHKVGWCRRFRVDFGSAFFFDSFRLGSFFCFFQKTLVFLFAIVLAELISRSNRGLCRHSAIE